MSSLLVITTSIRRMLRSIRKGTPQATLHRFGIGPCAIQPLRFKVQRFKVSGFVVFAWLLGALGFKVPIRDGIPHVTLHQKSFLLPMGSIVVPFWVHS